MKSIVCIFLLLCSLAFCQTTLFVGGASSAWTPVTVSPDGQTTNYISDPLGDQQTGQSPNDFVGTTTNPGFFVSTGTINGVNSIGFRLYTAGYQSAGYTGNLRVGVDVNGDGVVDLFFGPNLSGTRRSQGIVFQAATGPGNYSPSTTALGNNFGRIAFSSTNYNYQAITSTLDSSWTNIGAATNSAISFTVSDQSLENALTSLGFTITPQTYLDFIAFTSTQSNSINQDLYGSPAIVNTARFDGVDGGFSDYYALDGSSMHRPITPEPSTYGLVFISLASIFIIMRKKMS